MMLRRYSTLPPMWREMDRLQREVNRLFSDYAPTRRSAPTYPALNVWSNQDGLLVTAEVPGVSPQDIEISVVGDTLTLQGERKFDQGGDEQRYHRQERGYGRFTRTLQLPYAINAAQVEAEFKNGVLNISLPRAEEIKPRKIAVKTA
ncbi:MAG: Hsp20/alpha crystallin family protein [Chloroflexota bacterium]